MKKIKFIFKTVLLVAATTITSMVNATQIAPPKFQVVDKFGINVPSGQVSTSVNTVAIGGAMGLSHSVSTHTSNFLIRGGTYTVGLNDRYGGNARYEKLADYGSYYVKDLLGCLTQCNNGFYVMRVFDHDGSMDFKIMQGNYAIGYTNNLTSGYYYAALSDSRHTLEVPANNPGYLVWTKPDGTEVWYRRSNGSTVSASAMGFLEKVIYPTGFTLNFSRVIGDNTVLGVNTNTGFQLKYNYVMDNSPNQGIGVGNTSISIPPENTFNWSLNNPKTVVGINSAIEYCDNALNKICIPLEATCPDLSNGVSCTSLTKKWPTARFNWPVGMPRAFYFGENYFSIIDSSNRTTRFRVKAFDTAIDSNGVSPTGIPAGTQFATRLVGIKPANAIEETSVYSYKNYFTYDQSNFFYAYAVPGETGYIENASGILGSQAYIPGHRGWSPGSNPYAWQTNGYGISVVQRNDLLGAYFAITDLDGEIYFEDNYRNLPISRVNKNGPVEDYLYDTRGNLKRVTYNQGAVGQTYIEADFPATCTNRKTCNQANWISDAKGNKTFYTYHSESGQVATITYPANKNNLIAQTRFTYTQLYANYYNSSGIKTQGSSPVWMKTEERYCINSNTVGNGCANGDEVITRYEYQHDNLLMTGKTITDPQGNVLRTCYQYDLYGNLLGETQPKANLASCN